MRGNIIIGTYPVYVEELYQGHEPMKVVGIRQNEVELEGDYSGGTHNVTQRDWINIDKCFFIEIVCPEQLKPRGCQQHNLYCCGGSKIITSHVEYWKETVII